MRDRGFPVPGQKKNKHIGETPAGVYKFVFQAEEFGRLLDFSAR
jgi:hypothetical protein